MYYYPSNYYNKPKINRTSVLDVKRGDVTGDRYRDIVYLVGKKTPGSGFIQNITLIIQDGRTNEITRVPLKENGGYNPTIFLGDFTGDKVKDILISIDSGGSGGYAFYYIYSFKNNNLKQIFDYEKYNNQCKYKVTYKDNYKVVVKEKCKGKDKDNKYTIDIRYKGKEYLNEIYDKNGKLKEPIEGWVNPLGGLYPIDFQRDGVYELYTQRRIAGRYNADNLGYVQTSLKWEDNKFVPFFQTVGILG